MKKILVSLFLGITLFASASETVYVTPKGKKYHATKSCRSLSKSKNIKAVKISDVGGRGPCKICY
ncbi:MAG: hypothetical protein ACRCZO_14550 [Cetobacterium sp.]